MKYVFWFSEPFRARLTSKFAKSANMTRKKNIFSNYFKMGYQKTQNLMPSKIFWKSWEKNLHKESYRAENFCTQYWRWKSTLFLHFHANNFYNGFKISVKFCVFYTHIELVLKNYFLGHFSTFCKLWSWTRTKRPKKQKNLFFKRESELTIFSDSGFGPASC